MRAVCVFCIRSGARTRKATPIRVLLLRFFAGSGAHTKERHRSGIGVSPRVCLRSCTLRKTNKGATFSLRKSVRGPTPDAPGSSPHAQGGEDAKVEQPANGRPGLATPVVYRSSDHRNSLRREQKAKHLAFPLAQLPRRCSSRLFYFGPLRGASRSRESSGALGSCLCCCWLRCIAEGSRRQKTATWSVRRGAPLGRGKLLLFCFVFSPKPRRSSHFRAPRAAVFLNFSGRVPFSLLPSLFNLRVYSISFALPLPTPCVYEGTTSK